MTFNAGEFFTPAQVGEMFQVPVRTIHTLAREGKLPAIKVGRLWRFELEEIWKWVESTYQRTPDMSEIQQKAKEIVDSYGQL
jgi:excisionase family DNA binding protein